MANTDYRVGKYGYKYYKVTSIRNYFLNIWYSVKTICKPDAENYEGVSIRQLSIQDFWLALQGWELEF